jgi:glyoxylase-like metal-dependent hydrolase (beta-lactamase superfamily II)
VNTAKLMNEANPVFGQQTGPQENLFKEHGGHGLPTKTFTNKLTLGSGNDRIELRYYGRAHTSGDTFVIFPTLKVAHVGDVFPNKGLPIMDRNNGGSGVEYAETVDKAAKDLTALGVESLINGHTAAQTTVADLREYGAFVREFVAAATQAKKSGQAIEVFAKGWATPGKFAGFLPANEGSARSAAQVVFDEVK